MELFILRHGDAEISSPDSQRQLTEFGRQQVISIARQNSQNIVAVETVITSPLIRACQTAEIVMSQLSVDCSRQVTDCLLPDAKVAAVEQLLEKITVKDYS